MRETCSRKCVFIYVQLQQYKMYESLSKCVNNMITPKLFPCVPHWLSSSCLLNGLPFDFLFFCTRQQDLEVRHWPFFSRLLSMNLSIKCLVTSCVPLLVIFFLLSVTSLNPLNAELNPICYLLALLGAHHFLHISSIRVNIYITFISTF